MTVLVSPDAANGPPADGDYDGAPSRGRIPVSIVERSHSEFSEAYVALCGHERGTRGGSVSEEADLATVVGLLDDETARAILLATSTTERSAGELASECDASQQTVYRRLERLREAGLVDDRTRARKDGHHDTVYRATLDRVSIGLRDGAFEFELERTRRDAADELTDLWRKF